MKTASMMILPYLLLAFTGLPVLASASDGEDPAASLLQRGEDIVISGGNRVIRRKLKSTKSPACDCYTECENNCLSAGFDQLACDGGCEIAHPTGLPVLVSASDGEDPAVSLLQRGEDIVTSGGNRVIRRKLKSNKSVKSVKSSCIDPHDGDGDEFNRRKLPYCIP